MSADREPTAVEVIAEAVDAHDWMTPRGYAWPVCACGREFRGGSDEAAEHQASKVLAALKAAGFVVATRDEYDAAISETVKRTVAAANAATQPALKPWLWVQP